ncbi:MAG: hypothetical protein A2Z25_16030 [Planctomycetes bacterium RBG_16_55_9]|nr:MAG: hypothetical protein A2Z25_16030 [Planctomycetes bacterium RBG_16_55_9]
MQVTRRHVMAVVGSIVSSLLLVFAASCSSEKRMTDAEQPIKVKAEATEEKAEKVVFTANVFCSACHYGFDDEELALAHKAAGIGCERCHGESHRHRSDEANVTPPEIMYPKAKINPTCMMCHPRHEIQHVESHGPLLAGAETVFDPESGSSEDGIYCTTCHAKGHRINVRTIRWNKATGELLK